MTTSGGCGGSASFAAKLLDNLLADLEDERADQTADQGTDRKFKDCRTTCQARTWHDWDGRRSAAICPDCAKRDGPHVETIELRELQGMMAGGMPVERDELPADVWTAIGILNRRDAARMAGMAGFGK